MFGNENVAKSNYPIAEIVQLDVLAYNPLER
jgi:hypothetical protein